MAFPLQNIIYTYTIFRFECMTENHAFFNQGKREQLCRSLIVFERTVIIIIIDDDVLFFASLQRSGAVPNFAKILPLAIFALAPMEAPIFLLTVHSSFLKS